MGQKVNPIGFRVGVNHAWGSRWFAPKKTFSAFLIEDQKIREVCKKKLAEAGISSILIERYASSVRVTLFTARPGVVLGRKGDDVEAIRLSLEKMTKKEVYLDVKEVQGADADAQLVAESIAQQLERRIMLKRAMKRAQKVAMDMGVEGIKIHAGGRINGAEIARVEWSREGKVPLHTLSERILITVLRKPTPLLERSASRFGSARRKVSRLRHPATKVAAAVVSVETARRGAKSCR